MPRQIPYMSWLILIMPLSMSILNCAISFGKRRAGELFYNIRSAQCWWTREWGCAGRCRIRANPVRLRVCASPSRPGSRRGPLIAPKTKATQLETPLRVGVAFARIRFVCESRVAITAKRGRLHKCRVPICKKRECRGERCPGGGGAHAQAPGIQSPPLPQAQVRKKVSIPSLPVRVLQNGEFANGLGW